MSIDENSLGKPAWAFETDLLNILIQSIRETIGERLESRRAWTVTMVRNSISEKVRLRIDARYDKDNLHLAQRIMGRWMQVKHMKIDSKKRPTISFGKFPEGTECEWPGGCLAKSPTAEEKAFVKEFHEIVILRDLFCIQNDHLLANRWGGKDMIPLCGLHNRQKQDAMWPTMLIDDEVI